jgi:hypothetical protein
MQARAREVNFRKKLHGAGDNTMSDVYLNFFVRVTYWSKNGLRTSAFEQSNLRTFHHDPESAASSSVSILTCRRQNKQAPH